MSWNLYKNVTFSSRFVMAMRNEYTYKYVAFFVVYCIILVDAQKPIALFCNFSKQHGVNENFSKKKKKPNHC